GRCAAQNGSGYIRSGRTTIMTSSSSTCGLKSNKKDTDYRFNNFSQKQGQHEPLMLPESLLNQPQDPHLTWESSFSGGHTPDSREREENAIAHYERQKNLFFLSPPPVTEVSRSPQKATRKNIFQDFFDAPPKDHQL
ncbi:unnamed protein product, partial [Amoebophrya sp. A120]